MEEKKNAVKVKIENGWNWCKRNAGRISRTVLLLGLAYSLGENNGMKEEKRSYMAVDAAEERRRHTFIRK